MLTIKIPGMKPLELSHLMLDYNGTLAQDGELIPGIVQLLQTLSDTLNIHIITADTHGTVAKKTQQLSCQLHIIENQNQDQAKARYLNSLGATRVAAIGNGRNDILMLKQATLGIAVIQAEGAYGGLLTQADIVCTSTLDALNLLIKSDRMKATLRN